MALSVYLWGIRLLTLLSFCAWLGIVVAVDPSQAGKMGMTLFFSSLFTAALGMMTLFITWVYRKCIGAESTAHHLGGAFRQAFLVTLFFMVLVFFKMKDILVWWDTLLLLSAILLLEFSLRRIFSHNEKD